MTRELKINILVNSSERNLNVLAMRINCREEIDEIRTASSSYQVTVLPQFNHTLGLICIANAAVYVRKSVIKL